MDAQAIMIDAIFLVAGLVAGTVHFGLLWWNTAIYTQDRQVWIGAVLQVTRLGVLAGVLAIAALHGTLPLLLTALGLVIARPLVMRQVMAL